MATMRIVKSKNFSIVSNTIIRDARLSLKARGLLILMLSLPDNWEFSIAGLSKTAGEGKDSIRNGVKELEEAGYLTRKRKHLPNGKLAEMEYTIYEEPIETTAKETAKDSPIQEESALEKPAQVNTVQEETVQENPTEINKEYKEVLNISSTERERENTELNKEQKLLSQLNGRPLPLEETKIQNEYFKRFWLMYPRKAKQFQAQLAWNALPVDVELYERILQAVEKYSKTKQWADKTYVPYPENFLDGKRWEDDIPEDTPKPTRKNDVAAAAEAVVAGLEGMEW